MDLLHGNFPDCYWLDTAWATALLDNGYEHPDSDWASAAIKILDFSRPSRKIVDGGGP
jgi:hypothetical protein